MLSKEVGFMISNLGFYRQWKETRKAGIKKYILSRIKSSFRYGLLIYLGLFSCQIVFVKKIYPLWFLYALIAAAIIILLSIVIKWEYNEYKFKNVLELYKPIK